MVLPLYFISRLEAVVAQALANLAEHVNIRQKLHLDRDEPRALACLAAPPLYVEAEPPGGIAPGAWPWAPDRKRSLTMVKSPE